jgi:hypothetical protein
MFNPQRRSLRGTAVLAIRSAEHSRKWLNNKDESDERGDNAAEHRKLL